MGGNWLIVMDEIDLEGITCYRLELLMGAHVESTASVPLFDPIFQRLSVIHCCRERDFLRWWRAGLS